MKNKGRFYNYCYFLYPAIDRFFLKQKRKMATLVNTLPAGNLLEIGVGNGSTLPLYKGHIITGIDLSTKMLSIAKKRKTAVLVHLFAADGTAMKFPDETFDYVVINHVLSVTDNPERMLQEAYRVLKPDGLAILLNHFTPPNALCYLDRLFVPIAYLLQFRSYFPLSGLQSLSLFQFQYNIPAKPFGYYQMIVLKK
jgi:phosphatidylethanolamine/phosphatidyl-N-methylethanolamine N-methyltransferase